MRNPRKWPRKLQLCLAQKQQEQLKIGSEENESQLQGQDRMRAHLSELELARAQN